MFLQFEVYLPNILPYVLFPSKHTFPALSTGYSKVSMDPGVRYISP